MFFDRLGLGFSPSPSGVERRLCYTRLAALDQLLETPDGLAALAEELGVAPHPSALPLAEQLDAIRRRAIHLAVTQSPMRGLSIEEVIIVAAYASHRFDGTSWKRELLRQPTQLELNRACHSWLSQRSTLIHSGQHWGRPRWSMVGIMSSNPRSTDQFTVAVAPLADCETLGDKLERLGHEATFAHEHYVACSPGTALGYLDQQAHLTRPPRWDSLVLDRRLRTLGIGLLLVERQGVLLHLPARYQASSPRSHFS